MEARLSLPPDPRSPSRARGFVTRTLAGWELDGVDQDAALLVSELVTNALLYTRADAELVLRRAEAELRVELHDVSTVLPRRRHYSEMSTTGRGLALLEAVAASWGAERTARGKQVWFTLPLDPAQEAAFPFDLDAVEAL
jgi:anti-sigma regulatory factor (Ser/Thr protein kinase)